MSAPSPHSKSLRAMSFVSENILCPELDPPASVKTLLMSSWVLILVLLWLVPTHWVYYLHILYAPAHTCSYKTQPRGTCTESCCTFTGPRSCYRGDRVMGRQCRMRWGLAFIIAKRSEIITRMYIAHYYCNIHLI